MQYDNHTDMLDMVETRKLEVSQVNVFDYQTNLHGAYQTTQQSQESKQEKSNVNWYLLLFLCLLFGLFGVHRFYLKKRDTAQWQLATLGGLGVWWLLDLLSIVSGIMVDNNGKCIQP